MKIRSLLRGMEELGHRLWKCPQAYVWVSLGCLLCLLKVWVVDALPLVITNSSIDDVLFLRIANSFLQWLLSHQGSWLGPFNELTLGKGPVYPIWIAINHLAGLPLLFSEHLFYIFSGVMLILALKNILPAPGALFAMFLVFLFNPEFQICAYREGLYSGSVICLLAGAVGMYAHREDRYLKMAFWSIFSGVSLASYWMLREEGPWILPGLLLLYSYVIWTLYRSQGLTVPFLRRTAVCLFPFLLFFLQLQAVSILNYIYYDNYTVVDIKSPGFLAAYGALSRVKHPEYIHYVLLPKEVRKTIYRVSPSFQELEKYFEDPAHSWANPGCRDRTIPCGEIHSGVFIWAFRDAVYKCGYYKTGATAEEYYHRLSDEINKACEQGLLSCLPERATLIPPFRMEDLMLLPATFWHGVQTVLPFQGISPWFVKGEPIISAGNEELRKFFHDLTHEEIAPLEIQSRRIIHGWAFSPQEEISFRISSDSSVKQDTSFCLEKRASVDIYEHFHHQYANARNCRFLLTTACREKCRLTLSISGGVEYSIDLDNLDKRSQVNDPRLLFFIDSDVKANTGSSTIIRQDDPSTVIKTMKFEFLSAICRTYHLVIYPMFWISLFCHLFVSWIVIRCRRVSFLWIFNTAILIMIISRLVLLTWMDITSVPTIDDLRYPFPIYPMLLIYMVLCVVDLVRFLRKVTAERMDR